MKKEHTFLLKNNNPFFVVLSIEKDFRDNYGMPDIANFVQKVTCLTNVVDDERPIKTSSVDVDRSCSMGTKVLNFLYLVMFYGTLSLFLSHY